MSLENNKGTMEHLKDKTGHLADKAKDGVDHVANKTEKMLSDEKNRGTNNRSNHS